MGFLRQDLESGGFAQVVLDSVSPQGIRLTTFHLRYWRSIHAELMTHRDFSRNARSSRAVPTTVLLTEPIFTPQFGMNKPGMQSELKADDETQARWAKEWQALAELTRKQVGKWHTEGMHKQWANRPLEWFGWIDVLVSATHYENFFELRISKYAQPEFDELAGIMQFLMTESEPQPLAPGEWHLPYILKEEHYLDLDLLRKLSAARCARLSYKPFDGNPSIEKELERYSLLIESRPVHASPVEHQATPDRLLQGSLENPLAETSRWEHPEFHGNFHGWVQYRKTVPYEVIRGQAS